MRVSLLYYAMNGKCCRVGQEQYQGVALAPLSFPLPSVNGRLLAPRNLLSKTMLGGLGGGMSTADEEKKAE